MRRDVSLLGALAVVLAQPWADVVLSGDPQLILALFAGARTAAEAADLGLQISGDARVLERVLG